MDEIGIERAHLVGHSLGGAIAAKLAELHPEKVARLVLQDAAGLGKELGLPLRLLTVPGLGELLTRQIAPDDFARFEASQRAGMANSAHITSESMRVAWEMLRQPNMNQIILKILRQSAHLLGVKKQTYGPILDGLPGIQAPALVVWGRQDALVPLAHGEQAARLIPHARLEIIEGCGHTPCLEKPEQFNQAVLSFLQE